MAAINPRLIQQSHGNIYAAQKRKQNSSSQDGRRTRPRVEIMNTPTSTPMAMADGVLSPSTPIDLLENTPASSSISAITSSVSESATTPKVMNRSRSRAKQVGLSSTTSTLRLGSGP